MKKENKITGLIIPCLIISGLAFLVYSNTFNSPFQFDDHFYVAENARIRDISGFWPPFGARYVVFLSFAANYFSGLGTLPGLHSTNTAIHAVNGILVFFMLRLTLSTGLFSGAVSKKTSLSVPLLAALVFVAHPVQTEAVTYITQRFASLTALFYLLAIALYLKARLTEGRARAITYVLSIAAAILAQKSKETAFTLPFIIALVEFTFFTGPKKRALYLLPFFLTLAIIPLDVFGPELGLLPMDGFYEMMRKYQMRDLKDISRLGYLLTQFSVIAMYLRLLVLPLNQNADYDFPLVRSMNAQTALSFLLLLALFAVAIYLFMRGRKDRDGLLSLAGFGVLWFFITLSVESSIIPIKDIAVEHRLYLPSLGIFISIISLIIRFFPARGHMAVILALIALGAATYKRNAVWTDVVRMCEDVAAKSPGKATAHYMLANAYAERDRPMDALSEYRKAAALDPDDAFVRFRLSELYERLGDAVQAEAEYREFQAVMARKRRR